MRGPRQIGKSSWLKAILSRYASEEKCFYVSCENFSDHRELAELLASVRDCKVVLLDEVNFVKDWDRAVKHELDVGKIPILVVTGSHAHDLKKGADRMPGRFGEGGEFLLLPMGFEEFEKARRDAGWHGGDRLAELRAYFRVGGFPIAVAEGGASARLPKRALDTYWRWLSGDAARLGKSEGYLEELLIQVAVTLQTPVSLQTLAKKTQIGSHNTVQEYVSLLESCFALRTLYAVDLDTGAYRPKKDKKLYFTDPLLYWLAWEKSGRKPDEGAESKLAEQVAHESLARANRRFGYWSGRTGEVDFVLPKEWAVEVKWAPAAANLSKAYLHLVLPSKKVWTQGNFLE